MEGDEKLVLDLQVHCEGIPYGDCFAVQVRWVARKESASSIRIEVGVFVDFLKSTIMKGRIDSGATAETTAMHKKLFDDVKVACLKAVNSRQAQASETYKNETTELPEAQIEQIDTKKFSELEAENQAKQINEKEFDVKQISELQVEPPKVESEVPTLPSAVAFERIFEKKFGAGLFAAGFISGMLCVGLLFGFRYMLADQVGRNMPSSEVPTIKEIRDSMKGFEKDLEAVRESLVEIRAILGNRN